LDVACKTGKKEVINLPGWAISFTFTGYLLILLGVSVIVRILFSFLLIAWVLILSRRDRFLKSQTKLVLDKLRLMVKVDHSNKDHAYNLFLYHSYYTSLTKPFSLLYNAICDGFISAR
jgi:small-conductance mechanosensitive channel